MCKQFKFEPKSSICTVVINILIKFKMAVAAILDFKNFALLMKFSNFCYVWVCTVQITAQKLDPYGSY